MTLIDPLRKEKNDNNTDIKFTLDARAKAAFNDGRQLERNM